MSELYQENEPTRTIAYQGSKIELSERAAGVLAVVRWPNGVGVKVGDYSTAQEAIDAAKAKIAGDVGPQVEQLSFERG